jgi:hypothetical protein
MQRAALSLSAMGNQKAQAAGTHFLASTASTTPEARWAEIVSQEKR